MSDCIHYDYCNAPICPLRTDDKHLTIWFPDEEICRLRTPRELFIRIQKKIKKRTKSSHKVGYFTIAMLEILYFVRTGIKGIDPESKTPETDEDSFIRKRKKAYPTPEAIALRRQQAKDRALSTLKAFRYAPSKPPGEK